MSKSVAEGKKCMEQPLSVVLASHIGIGLSPGCSTPMYLGKLQNMAHVFEPLHSNGKPR